MSVTLESLEMTPEELASCKDAVQKTAYLHWLDAGCPECGQLDFWLKAEREWIESNYVPHRTFDGTRPESGDEPGTVPPSEIDEESASRTPRPRRRAKVKVQ